MNIEKNHPASTDDRSARPLCCGLLASGSLGYTALQTLATEASLVFVMTDRKSVDVLEYCKTRRIPAFVGNPRGGVAASFLELRPVDVVFSVNYLFIVENDVLQHPRIAAVNLHGSLLPKYRGRTPHVWAIINNESETGVTAHLMEGGCDTGDILMQHRVPISKTDTGASLLQRFHIVYPALMRTLLSQFASNTWRGVPQDQLCATYFHRRTPEDGRIRWDWQRERIANWIRAQSRPYPGAFFELSRRRFHVHGSQFSDLGFDSATPNGTVLAVSPLTIKTPNGAIELKDHDAPDDFIRVGEILDN